MDNEAIAPFKAKSKRLAEPSYTILWYEDFQRTELCQEAMSSSW